MESETINIKGIFSEKDRVHKDSKFGTVVKISDGAVHVKYDDGFFEKFHFIPTHYMHTSIIALSLVSDWQKNDKGHFVCSKEKPMPSGMKKEGRWEHDDVHETDYNGDYSIEWKCNSCGHIWRTEIPD